MIVFSVIILAVCLWSAIGEAVYERDWPRDTGKFLLIAIILLICTVSVFGQGSYYSATAKTVSKTVAPGQSAPILTLPFARITVCTAPASPLANGVCTNQVPVFSDVAMTQQIAQPIIADGQGNFGFYVQGGQYAYSVANVYGTWLLNAPFTIFSGGTDIPIEQYLGADLSAKLSAADAAATPSVPVTFTVNVSGTFPAMVTLSQFHSLRFNANVSVTNSVLAQLGGDQKVSCAPGVTITGVSRAFESIGTSANGHPGTALTSNLDLGEGCHFTGFAYAAFNFPAYMDNLYIHDATIDNGRDALVLGNAARTDTVQPANVATLADDVSQPHNFKAERLKISNLTGTGLNIFNSHSVEGSHIVCKTIGAYCMVATGGDAGGFQVPIGNMSDVNFHDNECDVTFACEWAAMTMRATMGKNTIGRNTTDVQEDFEGVIDGLISGGVCFSAGTGCATTFFSAKNITISNMVSSDSRIYIKNSSNDPSTVSGIHILNNAVANIATEAASNIEVTGNAVTGPVMIGFSSGLEMLNNRVTLTAAGSVPQFGIDVSSPFDGRMAHFFNNRVRLIGTPVTGSSGMRLRSGFFNADTLATFDNNWNEGFPNLIALITDQANPGSTFGRYFLHFNHCGVGTCFTHTQTAGTGFVTQDTYFDSTETLRSPLINTTLTGSGSALACLDANGKLTRGTATTCP